MRLKFSLVLTIFAFSFFSCRTTSDFAFYSRDLPTSIASNGVPIMGKGQASALVLRNFFVSYNPSGDVSRAFRLAKIYIEEARAEGVNSDVAFVQMCLETGFLKFGNLVSPKMNNFCGLGSISADAPGLTFETERLGVRAHIQHLKGYGSSEPIVKNLIDPRYKYISPKGKSPTVLGLSGSWASDAEYGKKIMSLYERLYAMI